LRAEKEAVPMRSNLTGNIQNWQAITNSQVGNDNLYDQ